MNRLEEKMAKRPSWRSRGFTLVEVMIVLAIIGIITATMLPAMSRAMEAGRGRAAAKSVADAFHIARATAIRTGNNQIVFFDTGTRQDVAGNAIQGANGQATSVLILDDGQPGSAGQNCIIEPGEGLVTFENQIGVTFGATQPLEGQVPPNELLAAIPGTGSSFRMPNDGAIVNRVVFRPDGVPVAFDDACVMGRLGSGGGTIYVTTTNRDFAITLSPLGMVRVHTWIPGNGGWTS
jgi:type IV fimbrial biogenesis protein FimT